MKSTIVCLAGKRLQIQPSKTAPGRVLLQILSADREVQASVTFDAVGVAEIVEGAIEAAADRAIAHAQEVDAMIGAGVGHD